MFDSKELNCNLFNKKYILNKLKLNFNEIQLEYIYNTIWKFYLKFNEQTKITF